MKHDVKIVIGANLGDEGKGLLSNHFTKEAIKSDGYPSITVLHNGTAQRGHTVDYSETERHVWHNFGAGSMNKYSHTYYAPTFLVHPMDFVREAKELGFVPKTYIDPNCFIVTPFDMLADHMIEAHIEALTGVREYGSCGYGSWSATDRLKERPDLAFTVTSIKDDYYTNMKKMWSWVEQRIEMMGIDKKIIPEYAHFFTPNSQYVEYVIQHFYNDLDFMYRYSYFSTFDDIWEHYNNIIFEGAQGLLLDKDQPNDWTTTSKTGLYNPYTMLNKYDDYSAEVCYVTRSYLTRHGDGPLDTEVAKDSINADMVDLTNQPNPFQGTLRYGTLNDLSAIEEDFKIAAADPHFSYGLAVTHLNEKEIALPHTVKYTSDNKFGVTKV